MMTKEEVKALGILVSVKNDSVRSEEYLHLYFFVKVDCKDKLQPIIWIDEFEVDNSSHTHKKSS